MPDVWESTLKKWYEALARLDTKERGNIPDEVVKVMEGIWERLSLETQKDIQHELMR